MTTIALEEVKHDDLSIDLETYLVYSEGEWVFARVSFFQTADVVWLGEDDLPVADLWLDGDFTPTKVQPEDRFFRLPNKI